MCCSLKSIPAHQTKAGFAQNTIAVSELVVLDTNLTDDRIRRHTCPILERDFLAAFAFSVVRPVSLRLERLTLNQQMDELADGELLVLRRADNFVCKVFVSEPEGTA